MKRNEGIMIGFLLVCLQGAVVAGDLADVQDVTEVTPMAEQVVQEPVTPVINDNDTSADTLVNIGLSQDSRSQMAELLNNLLANEYVLYTKTNKYHWNVIGMSFGPLHSLFKKQYEELAEIVDHVAERVRALGFKAVGTLAEFVRATDIQEEIGSNPDDKQMIKNLLEGHEAVIKQLRQISSTAAQLSDEGTVNMVGGLIEGHEKTAWMLRAHLQ